MNSANNYCIIMAGGSGTRFWPLSRAARPKQFLDILGKGKSFLRTTFYRFAHIVPIENIIVVASEQYAELVRDQLPQLPEENLLLEPYKRNTAPCIAYAAYKLRKKNPDANVVVTPSDHLIIGEDNFVNTIKCALEGASVRDSIFTIGIEPTRPDTNYGYIQISRENQDNFGGHYSYGVKTFTEKPSADLAKVFVESDEFLWNSGMFISNVKTLIGEFEKCLKSVADTFAAGVDAYYTPREKAFIKTAYCNCENISVDYGVMEKTDKVSVIKADFGWSDIGTWTSVYEHSPNKDANSNAIKAGEAVISGVKNSIIHESDTGKLVVIRGLDNFIVVDTGDVLMICPKEDKVVKEIVNDLSVKKKKYL